MDNLIITEVRNKTREGIILVLNKPYPIREGGMASKEWFVSWDKIGRALFGDVYADELTVSSMDEIRKAPTENPQ